jgi:hypothetical protein
MLNVQCSMFNLSAQGIDRSGVAQGFGPALYACHAHHAESAMIVDETVTGSAIVHCQLRIHHWALSIEQCPLPGIPFAGRAHRGTAPR